MTESPSLGGNSSARIMRLRIRGFRSYGTEVREVDLDSPITVIKGDNSQGKTATAEALEFLFTGRSSRRDLFGGAKAEYERMLANVHLVRGDNSVWVEADIRCPDGVVRIVRRTLNADYSSSADCSSTVTVNSKVVTDLSVLGIPFGEPPLAAPVLLQHNLRYVLSTEPQKRALYFRSLLEVTDLDIVRDAVGRAKTRVANLPPLTWIAALSALKTATLGHATATSAISKAIRAADLQSLTAHLLAAAQALMPSLSGADIDSVIHELRVLRTQAEERVFPIGALTPRTMSVEHIEAERLGQSIRGYNERLSSVDSEVARLAPIFGAVLNHPHLGSLAEPVTCPVCNAGELAPERIVELRQQLAASAGVEEAAGSLVAELRQMDADVDHLEATLQSILPSARSWSQEEWAKVAASRDAIVENDQRKPLRLDSDDSARGIVLRASAGLERLQEIRNRVKNWTVEAAANVGHRTAVSDEVMKWLAEANECASTTQGEARALNELIGELHQELGEKMQLAALPTGIREILDLLEHRETICHEQRIEAQRKRVKQRVDAVGRAVQAAEQRLLDDRFERMASEIDRWWTSLRPDELVRFGGVGPRASGRRYVNLTAELAASQDASPEVRDAVAVFSDSQLNALGLAAFIARQRLLGSPVIILDDPLPGYDPDHRVTFTLNTLGELLDDGVQVIICTHDPKLAVNIAEVQCHRGLGQYELTLSDMLEGTAVTNQSDVFGRHVLEAQDSIASLTVEGRRNAANALRRAAERLAKQIIATGRTQAGVPTRVSEVGDKVLGELIPEVLGFALANDERGRWNLWKSCLNPGAHDDDVPLSPTLKTVLGDIKKLKKSHEAYWDGGLLK